MKKALVLFLFAFNLHAFEGTESTWSGKKSEEDNAKQRYNSKTIQVDQAIERMQDIKIAADKYIDGTENNGKEIDQLITFARVLTQIYGKEPSYFFKLPKTPLNHDMTEELEMAYRQKIKDENDLSKLLFGDDCYPEMPVCHMKVVLDNDALVLLALVYAEVGINYLKPFGSNKFVADLLK